MAEPGNDPLAELRDALREAEDSARRLADELPGENGAREHAGSVRDAQALAALLEALRGLVPPELQGQLRDLMRQVLLLLRALIDRSLNSLEAGPSTGAGPEIHDIEVGE
jgi:hypothetical protein